MPPTKAPLHHLNAPGVPPDCKSPNMSVTGNGPLRFSMVSNEARLSLNRTGIMRMCNQSPHKPPPRPLPASPKPPASAPGDFLPPSAALSQNGPEAPIY